MHENTEKPKGLTHEEALEYVRGALHEVQLDGITSRCIDGRYPAGLASMAMAGGDAGLLMAGLAAAKKLRAEGVEVSNEEVRDAVFEAIGGEEYFNFHTDAHAMEKDGAHRFDGCGHCRLMKEHAAEYLLDQDQADFLARTLEEVSAGGVEPDVLEGSHGERAVMIVNIKNMGDKAWAIDSQATVAGQRGVQAFVCDATLVEKRCEALAHTLSQKTGADEAKLMAAIGAAAQKQLDLTADALAKGIPVYTITVDGKSGAYTVEESTPEPLAQAA